MVSRPARRPLADAKNHQVKKLLTPKSHILFCSHLLKAGKRTLMWDIMETDGVLSIIKDTPFWLVKKLSIQERGYIK